MKRNHSGLTIRQHGKTEDEYLEFCGLSIGDDFEKVKNSLLWCTKGKGGKSTAHWVKLVDCDTNHLENIITEVKYVHQITKRVILSILKERWGERYRKENEAKFALINEKIRKWKEEGYQVEDIGKLIGLIEKKNYE